jgi:hypothetical protein
VPTEEAQVEREELQILCKAFDWMIQSAQYHCMRNVVGKQALIEVNKKEVHEDPGMPFECWMDRTTIERYTEVWRQILMFVFRTQSVDINKRPPYRLTSRQEIRFAELKEKIHEFQTWKKQEREAREGSQDSNFEQ